MSLLSVSTSFWLVTTQGFFRVLGSFWEERSIRNVCLFFFINKKDGFLCYSPFRALFSLSVGKKQNSMKNFATLRASLHHFSWLRSASKKIFCTINFHEKTTKTSFSLYYFFL